MRGWETPWGLRIELVVIARWYPRCCHSLLYYHSVVRAGGVVEVEVEVGERKGEGEGEGDEGTTCVG